MRHRRTIVGLFIVYLVLQTSYPVSARLTTFDDYQFIGDTRIQAHDWEFDLDVVVDWWSVTGRVLTYQYYHVNESSPINYISPVDILLGTGPLLHGADAYNLSYSWGDRVVTVTYPTIHESVVIGNIGNVHCIARGPDELQMLKTIENGTIIRLTGYLVNVTGTNGSLTVNWDTDTVFGNEECEILVITDIRIGDITTNDLIVAIVVICVISVSAIVTVIIHRRTVKRCAVKGKDVGKLGK